MAEGRAGALEDYATAAFSVSGVKQDISLEDWKGGWASIVGGLNGKPTSQQFNMVTYILSALLNQAISDLSTVKGTANSALPKSDFTAKQIVALLAAYGLMEGCDADTVDSSMIFTENLDHNPQAVTLEKLPDGTAWLYLRKDAHEVRTEAPEGEQGGTSWECTTALCKLGSDYAEETVESITAAADDWWVYAEAWTTADEAAPSLEERVSVLETLFMGGEL